LELTEQKVIPFIRMASLEGFEPTTRCLEELVDTSRRTIARPTACLLSLMDYKENHEENQEID
jgi:hypothetical protein